MIKITVMDKFRNRVTNSIGQSNDNDLRDTEEIKHIKLDEFDPKIDGNYRKEDQNNIEENCLDIEGLKHIKLDEFHPKKYGNDRKEYQNNIKENFQETEGLKNIKINDSDPKIDENDHKKDQNNIEKDFQDIKALKHIKLDEFHPEKDGNDRQEDQNNIEENFQETAGLKNIKFDDSDPKIDGNDHNKDQNNIEKDFQDIEGLKPIKLDESDPKIDQNNFAQDVNVTNTIDKSKNCDFPDTDPLKCCKHDDFDHTENENYHQIYENNNKTDENNYKLDQKKNLAERLRHLQSAFDQKLEENGHIKNDLAPIFNRNDHKIHKNELNHKIDETNHNIEKHNYKNNPETDKNDHKIYINDDKNKVNEAKGSVADNLVMQYRFSGVFRSFREKPAKKWRRLSLGNEESLKNEPKPDTDVELSRSQYSLVSNKDLTSGAVQLWLDLPEEVKYDPSLAPFRQYYEKEHGKQENKRYSTPRTKRLPSVSSAPHLNNNVHVVKEDPFGEKREMENMEKEGKSEKFLEEQTNVHCKKTKMAKAKHYTKMTLLLAVWVFFTSAFLMYNEKEHIVRHSFITPGEVKSYLVPSEGDELTILLKVTGPLLSKEDESKLNSTELAEANKLEVWMERPKDGGGVLQKTEPWTIIMESKNIDFSQAEPRTKNLRLDSHPETNTSDFMIKMKTNFNKTTPFTMTYTLNPLDIRTGVIYACVLLCGLYMLIIFELINRTMAAILVATAALATLAIAGERPSLPEIISWLDVETLLLLFSMMLLVAITAETGLFDYLAVFTFEVTKGKLWPLITLLSFITAFISTFLDNVTTVLLMTPVTIRLCEVMDLSPIPVLMSMVLYSNIGGTATPVGDPPNVIIASNKEVIQAGINFTNFTLHMVFGILLVCIQTYVQLRFIFRDTNKLRLNEPRDIQDLRHQISIWRRAAESLPHMSRDEHVVRERLERKVKKLSSQLETLVRESNKRACPKDSFRSTLAEMKEKYRIRDKPLLIKSCVAIGFVVALFFLHSIPELNRVSLGWTALLGAILLLTLADREDLEPILHRVEWSTLLFFAALFVLMEALSKLGLIEYIGGITEALIMSVDEGARLAVAILLMLWVSGITSAFVDNIPLTTMMVRIVTSLGSNPTVNLPMAPLIWALSFGACLGGNGTIIGASANVVCAGVAEQHGYKFSFIEFFKVGFPVMIGHLIVASGYLLLCHCVFTWH